MSVNKLLATMALSLTTATAYGHSIFLNCEQQDTQVHCTGGFSDGSAADNLPIEVISYDDEPLANGMTDESSRYQFDLPTTDYYILLDAGPGHVVEVDMQDIIQ